MSENVFFPSTKRERTGSHRKVMAEYVWNYSEFTLALLLLALALHTQPHTRERAKNSLRPRKYLLWDVKCAQRDAFGNDVVIKWTVCGVWCCLMICNCSETFCCFLLACFTRSTINGSSIYTHWKFEMKNLHVQKSSVFAHVKVQPRRRMISRLCDLSVSIVGLMQSRHCDMFVHRYLTGW